MTPALATLGAFAVYFIGYRFYSKYLAERVFDLNENRLTPAHTRQDGVDYVPTKPPILFGHHYASITGLAPMLGPAIAVIWGWVPAMVWVVFGGTLVWVLRTLAWLRPVWLGWVYKCIWRVGWF